MAAFCQSLQTYTEGVASAGSAADLLNTSASALNTDAKKLALGAVIFDALLPDLDGVPEVLKETIALGQSYKSFTGLGEGMEGKVRFIWKLEGI